MRFTRSITVAVVALVVLSAVVAAAVAASSRPAASDAHVAPDVALDGVDDVDVANDADRRRPARQARQPLR